MNTWQPPSGTTPAKRRKHGTVLAIAAVPVLLVALAAAYFILQWNNIAFVSGPSRSQVTHTAEDLLTKTLATVNPPPTLGKSFTTFGSCGHQDGLGPVLHNAGIVVAFSGVAPADHEKFENQVTTQGDILVRNLKGRWLVSVGWDSPTSTTGRFHVYLSCTEIRN